MLVLAMGCKQKSSKPVDEKVGSTNIEIPNITVNISKLSYNKQVSTWTFNNQLFSGYAVQFHKNGHNLKSKTAILNGKKEKQDSVWHVDGNIKQIANYHNGKLHGEKKVWSDDAVKLSHLNYYKGIPHGEQKMWYPTGELHKQLQLNNGREEGLQRAFRRNGDLYANYEAKEGRIFGLKKSSLCYGLENENIKYEE